MQPPTRHRGFRNRLQAYKDIIDIDNDKMDEITLALLYLTTHKDKTGLRAWKSHSWDVQDRLYESGYIHDPPT